MLSRVEHKKSYIILGPDCSESTVCSALSVPILRIFVVCAILPGLQLFKASLA